MRITVLGKSPAWQDVDGACSGYLVRHGDKTVLLDCGNGVFGKLRQYHDYIDVDAIVISHLHADHFFDLIPYALALIHAPRQQPVPVDRWPGTDSPARPALHCPPGSITVFRKVAALWGLQSLVDDAFEIHEYRADSKVTIGGLDIEFCRVPHYIETYAVALADPENRRITYGADCCPNDALVEFGRGSELFIAEATLPRPERTGDRGHLTPEEAGQHARAAGADRLLVTHFSDELDPDWVYREAADSFSGPCSLAAQGLTIEIGGDGSGDL